MIQRLRRRFEPLKARALRLRDRLLRIPVFLLLYRVGQEVGRDRVGDLAAGMAYFAALSIFPLLLGVVAVLGFFLPSETIRDQLISLVQQNLPGATDLLRANIERIIEVRNTLGIVSIIGLFWTGSGFFGALGRAVNLAWDITVLRPWVKRKGRELLMALGTGVLLLVSLGITLAISIVRQLDLPIGNLAVYGGRVLAFLLAFGIFVLIYKYLPNARISWRAVLPGALLVAVLFEIARTAFTIYLTDFANYEIAYGPIASFIILLVWIYYSSFIILFGAEFSSEYIRLRNELRQDIRPGIQTKRTAEPALAYRLEDRSPAAEATVPSLGRIPPATSTGKKQSGTGITLPALLVVAAFPFLAFRLRRHPTALFLTTAVLIDLLRGKRQP